MWKFISCSSAFVHLPGWFEAGSARRPRRLPWTSWLTVAMVCALLVACGGGSAGGNDGPPPPPPPPADPGLLLLLVPDGVQEIDPGVQAWKDAASEAGVRLAAVTDAQFLAMGATGARTYAGLVLPDQLHRTANDAVVAAVREFTRAGGRTLLTFDFAVLQQRSDGAPIYAASTSRLSDLAGVDYALYEKYRDRTVGLGPVTAMRSILRELQVPPGKSEPFTEPPSATAPISGSPVTPVATSQALQESQALASKAMPALRPHDDVSGKVPLLRAAGVEPGEALYAPADPSDPGGVQALDMQQFQMLPTPDSAARGHGQARAVRVDFGKARRGVAPEAASVVMPSGLSKSSEPGPDALQAYSGYLVGFLVYSSYVTEGAYAGTVLAASPQFGLVAGVQALGAGRVMFVNLPLTYLKQRTDALPMHGMLQYFVRHVLASAELASVPDGKPGLMFNWHLDSMAAQQPMLALEQAGIFGAGPTSMHLTAGPDAITPGDRLGFDFSANATAQDFLRRMDAQGHSVGSHGGWIHDYYGMNASETNADSFLQYLALNRQAVDGAIGHPSRDYSAPQGNNPRWAMDWLEQQGVVAVYFAGHTGLGITRQYRDGDLRNPNLWVVPVTPMGNYATFEEFQGFNVPKADVIAWYHSLVDFNISQNTARMVYAHPPGAFDWIDVVKDMQAYVGAQSAVGFKWYTMARMADFMIRRQQVQWSEQLISGGITQFQASHPADLKEMVWRLPKSRYLMPSAVNGGGAEDGGSVWLVRAVSGVRALSFQAAPNPTYAPA
ncbi:MAG: hypothetical protein WBC18_15050 [Ottowia sp.]|uniref:hypothetical protein n=1 Tax=Ottowia sp. TaxID=1898956 RepID=UPI003C75D2E2